MAEFPSLNFESLVSTEIGKRIQEVGFAVIDNIFNEQWTTNLRKEIQQLYDSEMLYSNRTYYDGKKDANGKFTYGYSVAKPNVYELDLLQEESRKNTPYLQEMFNNKAMINHLNKLMPQLNLNALDIKVQLNTGSGGCFPMHFDTHLEASQRQITGTLYLNPDWKPEDGGQLRVYPFPYDQLDIEPINNRLVLFSSHQTLHRVLPSTTSHRYCITLWFSGVPSAISYPQFTWLRSVEGIGFILNPANRKTLSKLVYDKEWSNSIQQAFGDCEEVTKVLAGHSREVDFIKSKLSPELLSFVVDCLPLSLSPEFLMFTHLNKS